MDPIIRYARTLDGVNIAYFSVGAGPSLIYMPPGGSAGEAWRQPEVRSWHERLAANRQVIRLDYRGIGLSDRGWGFDPEATARDVEAVVLKEGLGHFAILGVLQTSATAIVFACNHPDRVTHLILWCPYASIREYMESSPALRAALAVGEQDWPTLSELLGVQSSGWVDAEQARRFADYLRAGADSGHYMRMQDFDIRGRLGELRMPVLVLHRRQVPFPSVEVTLRVASSAANGRFLQLEGSALMPFFGDTEPVLAAIDGFLADAASEPRRGDLSEREMQILALLASGNSNAGIAAALTISIRTVERHIGNIYLKIGAHNRADATAYAFRHRIAST
jgi:pimeloyl-ACP methyl ester carboxylesterase/DNA-binding CsgD family transcriptional regulator